MRNYKIQKIILHIGPRRLNSKQPDGKALVRAEVKRDGFLIEVYFDSRNVPLGEMLPNDISEAIFIEIEKTVLKLRRAYELEVLSITLPQDVPNGVWPITEFEKTLSREYKTNRREKNQ